MPDAERFSLAQRGEVLVVQVHSQLLQALLMGEWAPGERLNIGRLAASMGVSVTPVREALSRLISDGALRTDAKRAILVPRLGREELQEIFDLRILLEGELAQIAATRATDHTVDELEAIQAELVEALNAHDYKRALRQNARFHFLIYETAQRPETMRSVRALWVRISPTTHFHYPLLDYTREGISRHQQIIQQVRERNGPALRAAVVEDLKGSLATIQLEQT
ncbi:MAG: GntR family transcriptional regulator [Betaproteobacteria bacterium]|nr:GntR family transcriptional regulator [Betaproteobacteria bacterium]